MVYGQQREPRSPVLRILFIIEGGYTADLTEFVLVDSLLFGGWSLKVQDFGVNRLMEIETAVEMVDTEGSALGN